MYTTVKDKARIGSILTEAIDSLPNGFAVFDSDGRLICANSRSFSEFQVFHSELASGLSFDDAALKSIEAKFPDLPKDVQAEIAGSLFERKSHEDSVELPTDDDRIVQVTYRTLGEGRFTAMSVDLTELRGRESDLRKARQEAEAANEAKSQFLANVSHEIRTPLNGILGMAQVLSMSNLAADQREQVSAILDSGSTLMALLNDVLDLSKIEAGRLDISPIATDLRNLLERLHRLWKPRADERNIQLTLYIDDAVPRSLMLDQVRLRQCIGNLLSNAIKFTEHGRVDIEVFVTPGADGLNTLTVKMRDEGIGMSEETLGLLFQPFSQADGSVSRRFGGTGLGLAISRKLARLMGGDIEVSSREGKGSLFILTLECAVAQDAEAAGVGIDVPAGRTAGTDARRILIVDDLARNRDVVKLLLKPFGHSFVEAKNGVEALELLDVQRFDLIILDIHMPMMDGMQTIAAIRGANTEWSGTPVLAMTADAMGGDREKYLGAGMNGYVSKPIDVRALHAEVVRILAQSPQTAQAQDRALTAPAASRA